jgi:hypothetical protein
MLLLKIDLYTYCALFVCWKEINKWKEEKMYGKINDKKASTAKLDC